MNDPALSSQSPDGPPSDRQDSAKTAASSGVAPAASDRQMLRELAHVVRTKSAGPSSVRFDVFFRDAASFSRVRNAGVLAVEQLALLLGVTEQQIVETSFEDGSLSFCATVERDCCAELSRHEPLLDVVVP